MNLYYRLHKEKKIPPKKQNKQNQNKIFKKCSLKRVFFFRIIFGRMASICSPVKYIWFKYVHVAKKTYSMTFFDRHKTLLHLEMEFVLHTTIEEIQNVNLYNKH